MSFAALPRVDGRHRNRALAAARRTRAIELRAQGLTYEQIAEELGYANRGTVCRIVGDALATQQAEAIEDLRFVQRQRLDALQVALWDTAMAGDVKAAQAILAIVLARVRLLGLDGTSAHDQQRTPRTVVVPPT
ncbi:helix-turn-helix domain-containing protein [Pedococcus sp. 2YAF34]|uniref:helix-turn-helix domain-containing protein n=1 Tax=Pedococcus sp. 2YAF34 TaxID=3233032 RepID=UPI003F999800